LWIVTERAVAVGQDEHVNPVQSAFWGFGRTLAAEQPGLHCTLVDHDASADALQSLSDLLINGRTEREFALRGSQSFVPRLMPWSRTSETSTVSVKPRSDRTYLITGGLGALGLRTAAHLAQLGAGCIVLTSRNGPDRATQEAIETVERESQCRVQVMTADVGDEQQVRDLLARIREHLPPLAGVAHLAGVIDDALLPQQTWERFRKVLAPKALGAWHLHRWTEGGELDFFCSIPPRRV
jgi:hypothetical protein